MFSGIIEAKNSISKCAELKNAIRIWVQRPVFFNDIHVGDSIAVDGVCLTLEKNELSPNTDVAHCSEMQFTVGHETLKVLKRELLSQWQSRTVNLERSLRLGDRVHGHLVTGHVEDMGEIVESHSLGENWILKIRIPETVLKFCWRKGSLTVNGTSLTINEMVDGVIEHCLIPETQTRTHLASLKIGDLVCLEPDSMTKAVYETLKNFTTNNDWANTNYKPKTSET